MIREMANLEAHVDPFWDDCDAAELLMLYGMFMRARHYFDNSVEGQRMDGPTIEFMMELGHEAYAIYLTLMNKCAIISDATHYTTNTESIMGIAPSVYAALRAPQ